MCVGVGGAYSGMSVLSTSWLKANHFMKPNNPSTGWAVTNRPTCNCGYPSACTNEIVTLSRGAFPADAAFSLWALSTTHKREPSNATEPQQAFFCDS